MNRVCLFASFISSLLIWLPSVAADQTSMDQIKHIVVIYAENRSFDNLYGLFRREWHCRRTGELHPPSGSRWNAALGIAACVGQ